MTLEQYPTPAALAANLLHVADLRGDLEGRTVVDLGAGTGVLAIGAALRGAGRVVGVERDVGALDVARRNERRIGPPTAIDWVVADAARAPTCPGQPVTVVTNPPFGAQRGNVHADRGFLATAARLASVSYSVHNEGSREFVSAFAGDNGGRVTDAFAAVVRLDRQFPFHEADSREQPVEAFRIAWGDDDGGQSPSAHPS